jgi:hypothetical protein
VLLLGLARDGVQPHGGVPRSAAPLDRLQAPVKQEEDGYYGHDCDDEDHVHAHPFPGRSRTGITASG